MAHDETQICTRIINENIRNVQEGEALTMPLKELNKDCRFKEFYEDFCDVQEGINHFEPKILSCIVCKKEFKQKCHTQICCSKRCSKQHKKVYREANKDKLKKLGEI